MNETKTCPICGETYTEKPALSRADGETHICPICAAKEALAPLGLNKADEDEILTVIRRNYRTEATLEEVTAKDVERAFRCMIMGYKPLSETVLKDAEISTFEEANVPTWDRGFFIKCPFGEEFHVVITQTVK